MSQNRAEMPDWAPDMNMQSALDSEDPGPDTSDREQRLEEALRALTAACEKFIPLDLHPALDECVSEANAVLAEVDL